MENKNDPVNRPAHYMQGGIEVINILWAKLSPEEFRGYLKGNILKYTMRAEHKGNAPQDYAKAAWYAKKLSDSTNGG